MYLIIPEGDAGFTTDNSTQARLYAKSDANLVYKVGEAYDFQLLKEGGDPEEPEDWSPVAEIKLSEILEEDEEGDEDD